jgi:hypothetical protein
MKGGLKLSLTGIKVIKCVFGNDLLIVKKKHVFHPLSMAKISSPTRFVLVHHIVKLHCCYKKLHLHTRNNARAQT